jgi:hypothetical protein
MAHNFSVSVICFSVYYCIVVISDARLNEDGGAGGVTRKSAFVDGCGYPYTRWLTNA